MTGKKKYILISILSILLVFAIMLLTSYAWWRTKRWQSGENVLIGGCLEISYVEETSGFTLDNSWPMTDEDGEKQEGYTFTIKNTCPTVDNLDYEIVIESLKTNNINTHMSDDFVRVKLDDRDPVNYGDLTVVDNDLEATYKDDILITRNIYSGTLVGTNPETHTVKMWFSKESPEGTIGYQFSSKVKVYAGKESSSNTPEDCYTINQNGTITKYNSECGFAATIPEKVNNIEVRKIASDAFKGNKNAITLVGSVDNINVSIGMSTNFVQALLGDEAKANMVSIDDIWFINYKPNTTFDKASFVSNTSDETINSIKDILLAKNINLSSAAVYNNNDSNRPAARGEIYYTNYNGNYEIYGESTKNADELGLTSTTIQVMSIDLTNARYLEEIEDEAFEGLYQSGIILPANLQKIGYASFKDIRNGAIIFPSNNTLTTIGEDAFISWNNNNDLNISEGVTTIGNNAFKNYNGTGITLPSTLTSIGQKAFYQFIGNNGMVITIPNNVIEINSQAFNNYVGTFNTHSQALCDTVSSWASNANGCNVVNN